MEKLIDRDFPGLIKHPNRNTYDNLYQFFHIQTIDTIAELLLRQNNRIYTTDLQRNYDDIFNILVKFISYMTHPMSDMSEENVDALLNTITYDIVDLFPISQRIKISIKNNFLEGDGFLMRILSDFLEQPD